MIERLGFVSRNNIVYTHLPTKILSQKGRRIVFIAHSFGGKFTHNLSNLLKLTSKGIIVKDVSSHHEGLNLLDT